MKREEFVKIMTALENTDKYAQKIWDFFEWAFDDNSTEPIYAFKDFLGPILREQLRSFFPLEGKVFFKGDFDSYDSTKNELKNGVHITDILGGYSELLAFCDYFKKGRIWKIQNLDLEYEKLVDVVDYSTLYTELMDLKSVCKVV